MNTKSPRLATLACTVAALLATPAIGQVVPDFDTLSLAGTLDAYWNPADDYSFSSRGDEVLFATVDSELFQVRGRRDGDHEEGGGMPPDTGGGEHEEGDDCADDEDSQGALCLQLFDAAGAMLCWADRPLRPGWQRDPSLACPLPSGRGLAAYTLRIGLKADGCGPGAAGETVVATDDGFVTPYVLNWSLRRVATDGQLLSQSVRD